MAIEKIEDINRIVILKDKVKGDLSICKICKINFTAIQPCILCAALIEKQKKLGRKLNKEEFEHIRKGLLG